LVLLQRQRLQGPKDPIFIHGVNLTVHRIAIFYAGSTTPPISATAPAMGGSGTL
jgi:hypothetical protein